MDWGSCPNTTPPTKPRLMGKRFPPGCHIAFLSPFSSAHPLSVLSTAERCGRQGVLGTREDGLERESNSTHHCPSVKCPAHCHNQELAITKRKPRAVCVGSVWNTRAERAGIQHEKLALAWPGRTHIPRVCARKKLVWAGCPCTALSPARPG